MATTNLLVQMERILQLVDCNTNAYQEQVCVIQFELRYVELCGEGVRFGVKCGVPSGDAKGCIPM